MVVCMLLCMNLHYSWYGTFPLQWVFVCVCIFVCARVCVCVPGPYARAFLGLSLGFRGAPGFSLALGNWDRYVITDCSSTLGSMISSGVITCTSTHTHTRKVQGFVGNYTWISLKADLGCQWTLVMTTQDDKCRFVFCQSFCLTVCPVIFISVVDVILEDAVYKRVKPFKGYTAVTRSLLGMGLKMLCHYYPSWNNYNSSKNKYYLKGIKTYFVHMILRLVNKRILC